MSARTSIPQVRTTTESGSTGLLKLADRWHQVDELADRATSDAEAETLCAQRDYIEKQVMVAPCESASAALAKLRIIMAQAAPGASFEDAYEYPVFQQVTAWLEGQLP